METVQMVNEMLSFLEINANKSDININELQSFTGLMLQKLQYQRDPYIIHFPGLFRARTDVWKNVNAACTGYGHVNQLRYPPPCKAKASRCNEVGKPVFYCSTDNFVAISEVRPEVGSYVAVANFAPKKESVLTLQGPVFGAVKIITALELNGLNDDPILTILKSGSQSGEDLKNPIVSIIENKLGEWFSTRVPEENTSIYKLTTAIYNVFTQYLDYEGDKCRSIIYPSVAVNLAGYNIAMGTDLFEENLKLTGGNLFYVEEVDGDTYRMRFEKIIQSIDNDGKIIWVQHPNYGYSEYLHPGTAPERI